MLGMAAACGDLISLHADLCCNMPVRMELMQPDMIMVRKGCALL